MQFASYPLAADGAMRNWLACGTVTSPITDIVREVVDPEGSPFGHGKRWIMTYWAFDPESAALKMKVYRRLPRFTWQPGPPPILQAEGIAKLPWRYAVAEEDNVIDFSLFNFAPALMQGWLYANIEAPEAATVHAELITIGPARLWVNGTLVEHFDQHFSYVAVQRVPVTLSLQKGSNEVYVHGEMLGWREARLALGLRIPESPNLAVRIPLGDISAQEWHDTENGLNSLQFRQFAVPKLPATIHRAASGPEKFTFELEVASPEPDRFWAASVQQHRETRQWTLGQGETAELPLTAPLLDAMARTPGEHAMTMTWRPVNGLPLAVNRELWRSSVPFSMTPYGTYEARRTEALEHLAAMPYDVLTSMAAVTLGKQKYIASEAIAGACYFLENRFDCADFYAIGLLAMLNRFGDTEALRDCRVSRGAALAQSRLCQQRSDGQPAATARPSTN